VGLFTTATARAPSVTGRPLGSVKDGDGASGSLPPEDMSFDLSIGNQAMAYFFSRAPVIDGIAPSGHPPHGSNTARQCSDFCGQSSVQNPLIRSAQDSNSTSGWGSAGPQGSLNL
jgi:hypothetical protein